jgi:hypothetical protein
MKLRPKMTIFAVAFGLILFALIGAYFAFLREGKLNKKLTHETTARIDNVDVVRAVDPIFGSEYTAKTVLAFSYQIGERRYQRKAELSRSEAEQYVPWSIAKVCYEPTNFETIENPKLFPSSHQCGDD